MESMKSGITQEPPPFDVAWRTIDRLAIRYATSGSGGEKVVLQATDGDIRISTGPVPPTVVTRK